MSYGDAPPSFLLLRRKLSARVHLYKSSHRKLRKSEVIVTLLAHNEQPSIHESCRIMVQQDL